MTELMPAAADVDQRRGAFDRDRLFERASARDDVDRGRGAHRQDEPGAARSCGIPAARSPGGTARLADSRSDRSRSRR